MNKTAKITIVAALAAVVVAAVALKRSKAPDASKATTAPVAASDVARTEASAQKLPKMVDLGAGKCIPCKMMKPILEDLKANYADRFVTEFIDVWENPDAGKQYGIEMIPTQIFYNASGNELFRHEGFFSKEDIMAKWKELGVEIERKGKEAGKE